VLQPSYRLHTFFDVGANVGNTASNFATTFPEAKIYCFEPITAAFNELSIRMNKFPSAMCYRLGVSSEVGSFEMTSKGTSTGNSIVTERDANTLMDKEVVSVTTLDQFTKDNRIDRIEFLKIDTEGHDLNVLQGATGMLEHRRIDFVQVECGVSPMNQRHVKLEVLRDFLLGKGYALFGFYDQTPEFSGNWCLRRVDAVFIRESLAVDHS
jgi:FkbM family methyltransferase